MNDARTLLTLDSMSWLEIRPAPGGRRVEYHRPTRRPTSHGGQGWVDDPLVATGELETAVRSVLLGTRHDIDAALDALAAKGMIA